MAYDENGKFYLDPNDWEDRERYQKVLEDEQIRKAAKQHERAIKEQQEIGNIWNETLKEEGIDPQTYQELYESDPALAKELMKAGMKHLASGIKRGRDSKGRFTSQTPQHGRSVQQRREQRPDPKIDALREKARTGSLSSEEEADVIDALIGNLF